MTDRLHVARLLRSLRAPAVKRSLKLAAVALLASAFVYGASQIRLVYWIAALDIAERLLPLLGTLTSIVLMWRRAAKKVVNNLAERVQKQEAELGLVHAALKKCEDACAALVKENIDLLRQGQQRAPPPPPVSP